MIQRLVCAGVVLASLLAGGRMRAVAGEPGESPLTKLSWLAGCWERTSGDRHVEEQWMEPRGGMMLGMNRTVAGGRAVEFESMRIQEEGGGLVFTAHPSGQAEASFKSIELTGSKVVFENPAHDFPQRVIYSRQADGSLLARIEGEEGGKARGVDFPMRRASCPKGPGR